ncbi:MAG: hypothetical protein PHI27_06415 [Eubacteriales bacterium]|nr:hypothetical protein [Eubacteriales bacterium]MDD3881868.1 hypothetical protein [Eubacteriales bacterium]MDD4512887.1 hypothetical protein [Eubacteriales bacterium]
MKMTRQIVARLFPCKVYYADIAVLGMVVRVTVTAPDYRRARIEAQEIAEGGELLELLEA